MRRMTVLVESNEQVTQSAQILHILNRSVLQNVRFHQVVMWSSISPCLTFVRHSFKSRRRVEEPMMDLVAIRIY
jgi:hypothetical protein